jgi:hypothetical protein
MREQIKRSSVRPKETTIGTSNNNGISYKWETVINEQDSGGHTAIINGVKPGTYWFTVENSCGSTVTDEVVSWLPVVRCTYQHQHRKG